MNEMSDRKTTCINCSAATSLTVEVDIISKDCQYRGQLPFCKRCRNYDNPNDYAAQRVVDLLDRIFESYGGVFYQK